MKKKFSVMAAMLCSLCSFSQAPQPVGPLPTQNQIDWQRMETYAFIHFGPNTFGDREWGYGDAPVESFAPTRLDCEQWAKTVKEAGMKGIILTAKHHDGFCLWPTKYTDYSVRNSGLSRGYEGTEVRGYEDKDRGYEGTGVRGYENTSVSSDKANLAPSHPRTPAPSVVAPFDVVGQLSAACKKYGLKLGLYLSPWDRHQAFYGTPLYVEYFYAQLEELLTQYGELFEVWFDGANGGDGWYGGAKETRKIDRRTYYNFPRAYEMVERLQPHAVIFSDGGPGCRWVGNEEGHADATNWAFLRIKEVYPGYANYKELQSGHADGDTWVASECNTSIRPGWFYHEREDAKVKTVADLTDLYYRSVGHNGTFLLNFPVDKEGLIHPIDSAHAVDYHKQVASELKTNLMEKAKIRGYEGTGVRGYENKDRGYEGTGVRGYENTSVSSDKANLAPSRPRTPAPSKNIRNLTDNNFDTYWATPDGVTTATLEVTFRGRQRINRLKLQEYIPLGQRVEQFAIDYLDGKNWVPLKVNEATTTIGYKRLLRFRTIETKKLRIRFEKARGALCINEMGAYYAPNALEKYDENGTMIPNDAEQAKKEADYSLPFSVVSTVGDDGILLDMGHPTILHSLHYKPAQTGMISNYELFAGDTHENMKPIASGEFSNIRNNPITQDIYFATLQARYLLLKPIRMVVEGEQPQYEKLMVR